MTDWYIYSGVSHVGQPRLWQNRFRQFYVSPINPPYVALTTETGDILTTESGEDLEVETIE